MRGLARRAAAGRVNASRSGASRVKPRDANGVASAITLSEEGGVRYLHFGTEWVQGAMRRARPFDLELEYTRQMMAWWLFLEPTRPDFRILQLGLGAGSLTKFCWRHCAPASIDVVEIDAQVIACARSMFALPHDDARLHVVCGAARDYLERPRVHGLYDVVQIDLYDAQARGPVEDSVAFYTLARAALKAVGIIVVNLFGAHAGFGRSYGRLRAVCDGRAVALPEIEAGNRVVLAFHGPTIDVPVAALYDRAKEIEARCGLPARRWADAIKREAAQAAGAMARPGRCVL